MRKSLNVAALIIVAVFITSCNSARYGKTVKPTQEELDKKYVKVLDVLNAVRFAINKAYIKDPEYDSVLSPLKDPQNALHHLSQVKIELANSFSKKGSTDVSFFVKAGGSRSNEKSSTFSYTFIPIKDEKKVIKSIEEQKNQKLLEQQSEELIEALSSLGTCLKKYQNADYDLDEIELTVAMKITTGATAGVDFKIGVVGITGGGEFEWGREHTLTLTFKMDTKTPEKGAVATK